MTDQPNPDTSLSPNATEFMDRVTELAQDAGNTSRFAEGGPIDGSGGFSDPASAKRAFDALMPKIHAPLPRTESGEIDWAELGAGPLTTPIVVPSMRMRVVNLPTRSDGTPRYLLVFDRCTQVQAEHMTAHAPDLVESTGAADVLVLPWSLDLDTADLNESVARGLADNGTGLLYVPETIPEPQWWRCDISTIPGDTARIGCDGLAYFLDVRDGESVYRHTGRASRVCNHATDGVATSLSMLTRYPPTCPGTWTIAPTVGA